MEGNIYPNDFVFFSLLSDAAYIGCYKDTNDHAMMLEFKAPSK